MDRGDAAAGNKASVKVVEERRVEKMIDREEDKGWRRGVAGGKEVSSALGLCTGGFFVLISQRMWNGRG